MSDTVELDDLLTHFDIGAVERGFDYFNKGRVSNLTAMLDEQRSNRIIVNATVAGSGYREYDVDMTLIAKDKSQLIDKIEGECDCPVGFRCKHMVATLLEATEEPDFLPKFHVDSEKAQKTLSRQERIAKSWFDQINYESDQKNKAVTENSFAHTFALLYFIKKHDFKPILEITLIRHRVLKRGGYGKGKHYGFTTSSNEEYLTEEDHEIIMRLQFLLQRNNKNYNRYDAWIDLTEDKDAHILTQLMQTKRCFFHSNSNPDPENAITLGEPKALSLTWQVLEDTNQALSFCVDNTSIDLVMLNNKPYYLDQVHHKMGVLDTQLGGFSLDRLLAMPPIPPSMALQANNQLDDFFPQLSNNLPAPLKTPIVRKEISPIPEIHLNRETIYVPSNGYSYWNDKVEDAPIAVIAFNYANRCVPVSQASDSQVVNYLEAEQIYTIDRDIKKERDYLTDIKNELDLQKTTERQHGYGHDADDELPIKYWIKAIENDEDYLTVSQEILPALEQKGWVVFRDDPSFAQIIDESEVSWYSDLEGESEYDYFSFKMGVMIEGEKVNLLPAIAQLLSEKSTKALQATDENEMITLSLPDGKILSTPFARIKPVLDALVELYSLDTKTDYIKLSKYQAGLLYEIQKAMGQAKLRWFGGEKWRQLGEKLSQFKSVKTVLPPTRFKAELRPYQQTGLNWLQFLREYELGGVLADEMGLGKTVQTLAHLSVEKNKKRLKKPVLIVAPTSLMTNWYNEAAQFVPHLKVIIFQGDDRHMHQDAIADSDIVLTTYPLLVRDKAIWLQHDFYYLILDEAQFIKNAKAKSTLIVHQIKAEHRLCLTGTPMENHLGELWSLFHFLMPGFLGESKQFKQLFRTPIEKQDDDNRRKSLAMRVNPFILRRQKKEVVTELPDKTEIVREVILNDAERDLYESIRLAMEKKVRDSIAQKGLARSHIAILEAILRLRQVCCHSHLLKLDAAKKAGAQASKLAMLKEMLVDMTDQGQRILIFSQFTTMLGLIENTLKEQGLSYVKLTGQTKDRASPINTFQKGDVPIFLISLKAGGTGLNLTRADTVIHYDPWWNPAVEDQATGRAHRIGQEKAVFVYKLIAKGDDRGDYSSDAREKTGIDRGFIFSRQTR